MKLISSLAVLAILAGCATVRQEDLQLWQGRNVAELDRHPIWLTMPVVRTVTADGTEIRNYVNSRSVASCSGGGSVFSGTVNYASYNAFSSCMAGIAACNNIFFIKAGVVQQYTPVGSGGMRCYTDERTQPGFNRATNFQ